MASALTTSTAVPIDRFDRHAELHLVPDSAVHSTVSSASRRTMRAIDVVGAVLLLVAFGAVMVVVAVLVARSSPGPIIFRQRRVGKDGQHFDVFKFRSMADGTHEQVLSNPELCREYEQNEFKLPADDPRITPVGRWIRRTSIDELPQLFNVLRGEMSLVGVRPIEDRQLKLRSTYDQELYGLHAPGLTGLWQVEGRSLIGADVRVELDRRFLEEWSPWRNVNLLLRTPRAVVRGAGAH